MCVYISIYLDERIVILISIYLSTYLSIYILYNVSHNSCIVLIIIDKSYQVQVVVYKPGKLVSLNKNTVMMEALTGAQHLENNP